MSDVASPYPACDYDERDAETDSVGLPIRGNVGSATVPSVQGSMQACSKGTVRPTRGARAIALVLVLSLMTAFGWSGHARFIGAGFNPPADGSGTAPHDGAAGHGTSAPPDKFFLPRQLLVETARSALTGPPEPQPAPPPAVPAIVESRWSHPAPNGTWAVATVPEGIGWSSPRTPTGPPAA